MARFTDSPSETGGARFGGGGLGQPSSLPQEAPIPLPRPAQLLQSGRPGYGQNMTLAALVAKQQALAAQGDKIGGMESGTPLEGLAMMAQSFVNSLKERRAEKAMESGQAEVAGALAGLDWKTGEMTPEQREILFRRAPDTGVDLAKTFAELAAKRAETSTEAAGKGFEREQDLRKEYAGRPEYKRFEQVASSYQRVLTGAADSTAAGDMAVVYGFMKMQDPDSAVRETEYATAENARGIDESVRNVWNRLKNGERLTTNQRKMFAGLAQKQYADSTGSLTKLNDYFSGVARSHGVDPLSIITTPQEFGELKIAEGDDTTPAPTEPDAADTPAEPPIGGDGNMDKNQLVKGQVYLFKGGNKGRFQGLDENGTPMWSPVK